MLAWSNFGSEHSRDKATKHKFVHIKCVSKTFEIVLFHINKQILPQILKERLGVWACVPTLLPAEILVEFILQLSFIWIKLRPNRKQHVKIIITHYLEYFFFEFSLRYNRKTKQKRRAVVSPIDGTVSYPYDQ